MGLLAHDLVDSAICCGDACNFAIVKRESARAEKCKLATHHYFSGISITWLIRRYHFEMRHIYHSAIVGIYSAPLFCRATMGAVGWFGGGEGSIWAKFVFFSNSGATPAIIQ